MEFHLPEKVRLLEKLKKGQFHVPDFIYVPATDFQKENFGALEDFLGRHRESFKVIARSAHLKEEFFKSGTLDSIETYADLAGIRFARNRIIHLAETAKRLAIIRQQMAAIVSGTQNLINPSLPTCFSVSLPTHYPDY